MNPAMNVIRDPAPLAAVIHRRYYLENGIEMPTVTAYQMREIERISMEETGPDLLYMVERTGLALALLASELTGRKSRILVLTGRGAVAETGICAARHLAEQRARVRLCLSNPPFAGQTLSYQHHLYQALGGEEVDLWNLSTEKPDFIIDALMDYRSDSVPRGNVAGLIRWINSSEVPVLSLDVPSGVDPTTGEARGERVYPAWTLAPGLPRTGMLPDSSGRVYLADIGLRSEAVRRAGLSYINPFENKLWVPVFCETDAPGIDW